ncbi:MAG: biopolymer transporter ExbD [Thermoguttaceae bacterium]|nr:biopolymer transporter ExbD [Thermoguttaceae bacterium]MDW8037028.1 biopolymer transporter ExbD [Thermoguttaceae bacterium]
MKVIKRHVTSESFSPDMTPMIDVTFQLIIFFMLTINFVTEDQSERIKLPESELAKPPETPWESPIVLQLTAAKPPSVIVGGDEVSLSLIRGILQREKQRLQELGRSAAKATVIIRADRDAHTGTLQKLIKECQDLGFERFVLRAREKYIRVTQGT